MRKDNGYNEIEIKWQNVTIIKISITMSAIWLRDIKVPHMNLAEGLPMSSEHLEFTANKNTIPLGMTMLEVVSSERKVIIGDRRLQKLFFFCEIYL